MAKRKITIDRELFEAVREYSQNHDKESTCQHFKISLATLNNLLRYESYESMRYKLREAARANYEKRKQEAVAKKLEPSIAQPKEDTTTSNSLPDKETSKPMPIIRPMQKTDPSPISASEVHKAPEVAEVESKDESATAPESDKDQNTPDSLETQLNKLAERVNAAEEDIKTIFQVCKAVACEVNACKNDCEGKGSGNVLIELGNIRITVSEKGE